MDCERIGPANDVQVNRLSRKATTLLFEFPDANDVLAVNFQKDITLKDVGAKRGCAPHNYDYGDAGVPL